MPKVFQKLSIERLQIIAKEIYLLQFSSAAMAAEARPGQFVMVRPVKFTEPLLPRPFSIHRLQGDQVDTPFQGNRPGDQATGRPEERGHPGGPRAAGTGI